MTITRSLPSFQTVQKTYGEVSTHIQKAASPFHAVTIAVSQLAKVSKTLSSAADIAKKTSILSLPCTIISLWKDTKKALAPSAPVKERVISFFKSIVDGADIVNSVARIGDIFKKLGLIHAKYLAWTQVFDYVSFFINIIPTSLSIKDTFTSLAFYRAMKGRVKKLESLPNDSTQNQRLIEVLDGLPKVQELEQKLDISKKAALQEKINGLRESLLTNKEDRASVEKTKQFFERLRKRASLQFGLSLFGTITKIVSLVGFGLFLFTPLGIASAIIYAVGSVLSSGLYFGKKLFLSRNPLSEHEKMPIVKAIDTCKEKCTHLFHKTR